MERLLAAALLALSAAGAAGCTPKVGDGCVLSTDCGATGNLVCDTSEFEGYCTQLDCQPDQCPNSAGCILFDQSVPGCGYDDRHASRIGQSFCMAVCGSDSDCRTGYVCADPELGPWYAHILDDKGKELVCLPAPPSGMVGGDSGPTLMPDAAVCQLVGPMYDAFPPPPDTGGEGTPGD